MNGFILWEGVSVLDGAPIMAIATLKTSNPKTGSMVQTWIMRSDISPVEAVKAGTDSSVCGSCPHRHNLGGACYVSPWQAPLAVFKAYQRGAYPLLNAGNANALRGRAVRLGAYGDPAAVPFRVWDGLLKISGGRHTGYTHQAAHRRFDDRIASLCMVSADTPKQAAAYQARGLRTFRVKTDTADLIASEKYCPAESGEQCITCGLCDGGTAGQSVAINIHGSRAKNYSQKFWSANNV